MSPKLKPSEIKPQPNLKKGLWSPDEDQKLTHFRFIHPNTSWNSVPIYAGLQRNGKSCRLRWLNYLRPGLKRGSFSLQEEETILTLHASLGNKWSQISKHLPGRTDNEIKNYWHTYLKKRFAKSDDPRVLETHTSSTSNSNSNSNSNSSVDITNSSSADMDQSFPPGSHVNSQDQESSEARNYMNIGSNEDRFHTQTTYEEIFNFDYEDFDIDDDFLYM